MKKTILMTVMALMPVLGAAEGESIKHGEEIYKTVCFACHGNNFEGAAGPSLKDAEWMHGGESAQILESIKQGFAEKGMPPFGTMYDAGALNDVLALIESRQEGLRNVKYEIFHGLTSKQKMDTIDWEKKGQKNGTANPAFVDFNIPEVDEFGMVYRGELLIAEAGQYRFSGKMRQQTHMQVLIDGQVIQEMSQGVQKRGRTLNFAKELSAGQHEFEMRFVKDDKYCDVGLMMSKGALKIPLTVNSWRALKDPKHIVIAKDKALVLRKRIEKLPPKTIAVGFPEQVNYAINPADASINALWFGAFIDIGPNIEGRGNRNSEILGEVSFAGEMGLRLLINDKAAAMNSIKYTTYDQPQFFFDCGGRQISIKGRPEGDSLALEYQVEGLEDEEISFQIPKGAKISGSGALLAGRFVIDEDSRHSFKIILSK